MLDRDLAELYQVTTSALNQAVKRNIERFPSDFMFQLTDQETEDWKSQIVITNSITMGLRRNPYAFIEQGVSMLSAVLKSPIAIQTSIAIMRAFVAMRNYITTTTQITAELAGIRAKPALLERADSENAEAVSDLSEDMRKELDNIYQAIAALSIKIPQARKSDRVQTFGKGKITPVIYFHSIGEIGFFLMFRKFRIFNGLGKLGNSGFIRRYSPAAPALVLVTTSTKPLCNTGKTCPMCIGHNGSGIDRIVCRIPLHRISQTETKPCEKMPARALSTPRPTSSR